MGVYFDGETPNRVGMVWVYVPSSKGVELRSLPTLIHIRIEIENDSTEDPTA